MPQNIFKIFDGRNYFWQWDTNQKLIVLDDTVDEVHFSNRDMTHAISKDVFTDKDGKRVCYIPDTLLTLPKNLIAAAIVTDNNANKTLKQVKFAVQKRAIPSDYVVSDDVQSEDIADRLNIVEELVEDMRLNLPNTYDAKGSAEQALADAKEYVANKYDPIGSAKDVQDKLTEEVARAKNEEAAITRGLQQANVNVKEAQNKIDAIKEFVGDLPNSTSVKTIVEYIDEKTEGAISDEIIRELDVRIENVENEIDTKLDDLSFVSYNEQELTDEQKSQARKNIGVANSQSDWSVNDEFNPAYIKNKPFGNAVNTTDISGAIYTIGQFTSGTFTVVHDAIPLEVGQVWSVQGTNDANAKTVSVQVNDDGELYLGTPTVDDMPFYIRTTETTLNSSYWYQMQPSHLTLICVSGVVTTASVKQLSQKYIPNADWNVSDKNADGYVKNRTHYTVDRELLAAFEMSVENVDTYSVDDADSSDVIRRFINDDNHTVDVFIDGVLYQCQAIFDDGNYYINLDGSTSTFQGIRIYIGGSKPNMIYLHPESFGLDMSAETRMVEVYTPEVIQQLDQKYIKDMYYEESIEVFSVENATFNNHQYMSETPFVIEDGSTYIVNWDGIEYICEAYMFEGVHVIGNTSEFGGKGNDEPFCIGYASTEDVTFVNSFDDLTIHTFSVIEVVYHTIAPKYIKDMYYEELELTDIVLIDSAILNSFEDTESGFYSQYTDYHIDFAGTEGQTYLVIWDGIKYECVCKGIVEDFGIGNANILGNYGSTTNEPFALHHSSSEDAICVSVKDNSSHTLSVIQRGISPVIHQIDTKYLPILEENYGVIFEAEEVFDESVFEGPAHKKLLGRYVVVVDGVSENIEFIDNVDYSWGKTDRIYIETWDATQSWNGGYYIGFQDGNDVSHTVQIIGVKKVIKEEFLPDTIVPDWNQNDPNGDGYIANRPFYPLDEAYIGTLQFTATGINTMQYTYTHADDVTLFYFQELAEQGQVIRAKVNGCNGLIGVTFSRGYFSISGTMTGHFMFDPGRVWESTVSMDGIALTADEIYQVEFYDTTKPGYMPLDIEYLSSKVHTDKRAPVKFGTGDRATIQNGAKESSGRDSHAEGNSTVSSGWGSHAEGAYTEATGDHAHTEGYYTKAREVNSHSEGEYTIAGSRNQHVQGKFNIEDANNRYAHIVGNGTKDNDRSNAHTLDWSGNAWFLGDVKVGATGQDDTAAKTLATTEYVDDVVSALKPKCTTVTIPSANWTGDVNPWSQVVTVNGVTPNSKVDLQPTAIQIVELQNDEITLMLQNDSGIITAWAIGNKPTEDYTMDVLITEVVRV